MLHGYFALIRDRHPLRPVSASRRTSSTHAGKIRRREPPEEVIRPCGRVVAKPSAQSHGTAQRRVVRSPRGHRQRLAERTGVALYRRGG